MTEETTSTIPQETELKLELTPQALREFRASPFFVKMGLDRAPKHTLRSTYFDTSDHQLKAHKIALRVRDNGQGHLIQTLKTRGVPGDIAFIREEHETILAPQDPVPNLAALPKKWRALVNKLTKNAPLKPLFETQVTRQAALITTSDGDTIEIALDQGWVLAGPHKHQIREVEFELVTGKIAGLYELALGLVKTVPARMSTVSKSQRGYALLTPDTPVVQKAAQINLSPTLTAEEALVEIIRQSLRQIMVAEPAIVEGKQPEGVHQMRIALRRLRAGLRGFANWLGDPALMEFSIQAQALAASLGRVRDMDVFETEIMLPVRKDFPDHPGIAKILLKSKRKRAAAWQECLATVASQDFATFLLRLNLYVEQKAWRMNGVEKKRLAQPVQKVASTLLKRRRAKLQKVAVDLETLSLEQRHEMRKHIKKLRYLSIFFVPVFATSDQKPKDEGQKIYLKKLAKLQNQFGAITDVAMAQKILQSLSVTIGRRSSDLSEAFGIIMGWHMHRTQNDWTRIPALWKDFEERPDFWEKQIKNF